MFADDWEQWSEHLWLKRMEDQITKSMWPHWRYQIKIVSFYPPPYFIILCHKWKWYPLAPIDEVLLLVGVKRKQKETIRAQLYPTVAIQTTVETRSCFGQTKDLR